MCHWCGSNTQPKRSITDVARNQKSPRRSASICLSEFGVERRKYSHPNTGHTKRFSKGWNGTDITYAGTWSIGTASEEKGGSVTANTTVSRMPRPGRIQEARER